MIYYLHGENIYIMNMHWRWLRLMLS
jgi:hypothetical protein